MLLLLLPHMSEKLLLLPESKSPVMVYISHGPHPKLRLALVIIGLLMVLIGAASAFSWVANNALGKDAAKQIFAPAVVSGAGSAQTTATSAFIPARVKIPSIGVDAAVESVGTRADGSMDTPKNFKNVGWYSLGSKPGGAGNAVFAGHVNNALTSAGVFQHLSEVRIGDYVSVSDASGKTLLYRVTELEQYPVDEAPLQSIFSTTGTSQVIIYTCDGQWDGAAHSFTKRLVVFAKPA